MSYSDRVGRDKYHPTHLAAAAHAVSRIKERDQIKTVVDLGSGVGMLQFPLAKGFKNLSLITAIDNDAKRIKRNLELFSKAFKRDVFLETLEEDALNCTDFPSDRDLVITNPDWSDRDLVTYM